MLFLFLCAPTNIYILKAIFTNIKERLKDKIVTAYASRVDFLTCTQFLQISRKNTKVKLEDSFKVRLHVLAY